MSEVNIDWLIELAPQYYKDTKRDDALQRHLAESSVLEKKEIEVPQFKLLKTVHGGVGRPKTNKNTTIRPIAKNRQTSKISISHLDFDDDE